jgi:Fungal specific transcription factor domain
LQTQYENFWTTILVGMEPSGSLQAIVFAVFFSATVSMDDKDVLTLFSVPKTNLVASFKTATEVALGKANFLRTTRLETLQALVIYMIPMCRNEMSRAHSVLVGTTIRLAECMGLHRDPQETYGLGQVESHVRRMLWYQLCFLDIRSSEAQGPRPLIRRDEFDTNFPLNINDSTLTSGNPQESSGWTDMTFSRMRFECNEMHRVIWVDRNRLEKKQISLTQILGKIESFRKAMEVKYQPIMDETIPLQKEAKIVMDLQLLRMHIMVLHRYHNSVVVRIPDRLRQIILSTGTQLIEDALRLETDPALQPYAWYTGAYQQWHTAFLLLVEVFAFPMRKEADRIWRVLDYVFETDPSMDREQKARAILSVLRDRTGAYRDIRKIRAPVNMMTRIYGKSSPQSTQKGESQPSINFNSNPTPPGSRGFQPPPNAQQQGYMLSDYLNPLRAGRGSLSPASSNRSQRQNQSAFNNSQAAPVGPSSIPSTASLGQMTKALADAPSPTSSADSPYNSNWTFDAPSSFFMPPSHDNKPRPSRLPGEQMQSSPPPSNPTASSDSWAMPNTAIQMDLNPKPGPWNGGTVGGDIGFPIQPLQGSAASAGTSPEAFAGQGGAGAAADLLTGLHPQAGAAAVDADMVMVDIDWVSIPCSLLALHCFHVICELPNALLITSFDRTNGTKFSRPISTPAS